MRAAPLCLSPSRPFFCGRAMAPDRRIDHPLRADRHAPAPAPDRCGEGCGPRIAHESILMRGSFLATTIRPLVSLSSRCTMPGRATPPMPLRAFAAMREKRIDQGLVAIAGCGMHDKTCGFVDHQKIFVFINDIQLDRLRFGLGRFGRRHRQDHKPRQLSPCGSHRRPALPFSVTWPSASKACSRARDKAISVRSAASASALYQDVGRQFGRDGNLSVNWSIQMGITIFRIL